MTGIKGRRWGADVYLDPSIDIGAIPYKGANGMLLWLTPGAAGKVIKSNGLTPSIPSYQDDNDSGGGGGSAGPAMLEEQTGSAVSALTFTSWYDSAYETFLLVMINIVTSASTQLGVQASVDTGANWLAGTNYNAIGSFGYSGGAGAVNGLNTARISMRQGTNTTCLSDNGYNGTFTLSHPASAKHKQFYGQVTIPSTDVDIFNMQIVARIKTTSAIDGLRIIPDSGTITGTGRIYGFPKT